MSRYHLIGIPLFFASIILIGYDIVFGNGKILLIVFIPIFYGSSVYFALGAICFVASTFLIMMGSVMKFTAPLEGINYTHLKVRAFPNLDNLSIPTLKGWAFLSKFVKQETDYTSQPQTIKKTKIVGGGIVFIGPIPIIMGSDKRTIVFLVFLAIILMFVMWFFMLFLYNIR